MAKALAYIEPADKIVNTADKAIKVIDKSADAFEKHLKAMNKAISVLEKGANMVLNIAEKALGTGVRIIDKRIDIPFKIINKIKNSGTTHDNIKSELNVDINSIKNIEINQNIINRTQNKKIGFLTMNLGNLGSNYFNPKWNYLTIIFSLIFINLIQTFSQEKIDVHSSIITIKINKTGYQNIYSSETQCLDKIKFDPPNNVIINGLNITNFSDVYYLEKEENIIELHWNNRKENWGCLFYNCINIVEIDFSKFDFSQNIYGNQMFFNCTSITSLNMNDFGVVKLKDAGSIFRNMTSLTSLNLSNFNVSEATDIGGMFWGCKSLKSLDLSNFKINNLARNVELLFANCTKLEYINLNNVHFNPGNNYEFISSQKNLVFCSDDEGIIEKILENKCAINDCTDNWRQNQKKLILENNECVDNCSSTEYKYNYNNICYQNCPNGTYNNNYICEDCHNDCKTCEKSADDNSTNCLSCSDPNKYLYLGNCVSNCINGSGIDYDENNNPINICKCDLIKCNKCNRESFNSNLCISCNDGYYPKYDDIINGNPYKDCYQSLEGYYFDSEYFKPCYESCQTCNKEGDSTNHNCKQCNKDFIFEININNNKNCFKSEDYENVMKNSTMDYIKSYISDNNNVFEMKKPDGTIYQITNSKNELELLKNKSNNINNISIIELGECEEILRKEYHIKDEDSLIIVKNENSTNIVSEKNLNYEVYEPYHKTKLNLSFCDNTFINVYIPMELGKETKQLYNQIKELGYDMFNINDPFYQDICTPYDSQNGTDMLLSDRINYIYNNDDTQCQSNCYFSSYSIESRYTQCSCSTNKDANYNNNVKKGKFSSKKIYESFYDVLKYSNYKILKCYKIILNMKDLKSNIGCIISLALLSFYIICLIIFIFQRINPLKRKLKKDLNKIYGKNDPRINNYIHYLLFPSLKMKSFNELDFIIDEAKINNKQYVFNFNKTLNDKEKLSKSKSKNYLLQRHKSNEIRKKKKNKKEKNNVEKIEIKKYSDFELNELEYKEAVKYDERNFFQIYISMLKREHLIIFTFFNCKDYNLFSAKLTRFIFLIIGDMALNTFFFSDESMHKLYLNYGKYNFIQSIPEITYSTIISSILEVFLCYLSLTDKEFYNLKYYFSKGKGKKIIRAFKHIYLKLIIFFIFVFIFFILYWYIITIFCEVYKNTQIVFIKDSMLSLIISLAYPLVIYFIPAGLRICSLKDKKKRLKCLYKLSDIIPFF